MKLTAPRFQRAAGEMWFWLIGHRQFGYKPDLKAMRNVLLIRPDEVGDVVLTSAFLRELRRNLPNAKITLIVKKSTYNIVELCPHVDRILLYPIGVTFPEYLWKFDRWKWKWEQHRKGWDFARANLWQEHFDLAIYLRLDADFYDGDFLTYASGAKWRMAYSENVSAHKKGMNEGDDGYLSQILTAPTPEHEVERNLDFLRALGGSVAREDLELWTNAVDAAFAERALGKNSGAWIAMGPGARVPRRVWGIENFIALACWLRETYDVKIVVLGSSDEKLLGDALADALGENALNLAGQTTLRQAAEILKHSALYIGNDSALLHLAAAARVPVLEISCHPQTASPKHPNSPARFGPWQVPHVIVRPANPTPPCIDGCHEFFKPHCILQVTLDQVKQGAMELLDKHVQLDPAQATMDAVH